jgi:ankyrin repeat protein
MRDAVAVLLEAGADARARGPNVLEPLFFAGDANTVRLLIQAGAVPNARLADGRTPLMFQLHAALPRFSVVEALLDSGADPSLLDVQGHDAMWYANQIADARMRRRIAVLLRSGEASDRPMVSYRGTAHASENER